MKKQSLEIVGNSENQKSENEIYRNTDGDMSMDSVSMLKMATKKGSQESYKEALILEKYRDALLEQANELRSDIQLDIAQKAKALAPRIFGWNNIEIPGLSSSLTKAPIKIQDDYERVWEVLVGLELQLYELEDPKVSTEYFATLRKAFLKQDLSNVSPKFLSKYPWLKDFCRQDGSKMQIPAAKCPQSKKKDSLPSSRLFSYHKTTSQLRLEKDMAKQEAELQEKLGGNFKAKIIPKSSLALKYDKIMENQGTKSTKIREHALKMKLEERDRAEATERELILRRNSHRPLSSETYLRLATTPNLEKKNAVMKEIMKECTFKPACSAKIPNFKLEQQKFEFKLEMTKSNRSTTIPVPFQLSKRMKSVKKNPICIIPTQKKTTIPSEPTIILAKPTKTSELKIQHRQREKDAQRLLDDYQKELLEIAACKKLAIGERLRVRLESTSKSAKERLIKAKKMNEKEYMLKMDEMHQRLDSRRCLFERVQLSSAQNRIKQEISSLLA